MYIFLYILLYFVIIPAILGAIFLELLMLFNSLNILEIFNYIGWILAIIAIFYIGVILIPLQIINYKEIIPSFNNIEKIIILLFVIFTILLYKLVLRKTLFSKHLELKIITDM